MASTHKHSVRILVNIQLWPDENLTATQFACKYATGNILLTR